jgi:hypothetical protein
VLCCLSHTFQLFDTILYHILASRISDEESTPHLIEDPLDVTTHFSLAALKILSLSLGSLIIIWSLYESLCVHSIQSLDIYIHVFHQLLEV